MSEGKVRVQGTVTECMTGRMFRVDVGGGRTVLAYLAGKLAKGRIKVITGDAVELELSPYDLTRARLIWRHRD